MEDEIPASAIEGVTVQMGSIPDAVLHLRRGVIIREQSYKMPISSFVLIAASLCIWNLPIETTRVLFAEGPTLLQVTSLGVLWGGGVEHTLLRSAGEDWWRDGSQASGCGAMVAKCSGWISSRFWKASRLRLKGSNKIC